MDNKDVAKEWVEIAMKDYESAKFLFNMKPVPNEIICYHCQQSVEKVLKGFLALNEGQIQKTHDLTILNKLCCQYDISFSCIEAECINLTDYGTQVRYPFHIDIEEVDVKQALTNTEKVIDFIKTKI